MDDAADAVFYAVRECDRLRNNTLNFSDFNPLPFRTMVTEVAKMSNSGKPMQIPAFLAKRMLGKSMYSVITGSHRIDRGELIADWKPQYQDFVEGMKRIILSRHRSAG